MNSITEYGDGVTRTFNTPPQSNGFTVTIDGTPTTAFAEGTNSITFNAAPAYRAKIVIGYTAAPLRSADAA
ncbi:MAG: hypothetical protein EPO12_05065, partial [Aquabacterium sp.]